MSKEKSLLALIFDSTNETHERKKQLGKAEIYLGEDETREGQCQGNFLHKIFLVNKKRKNEQNKNSGKELKLSKPKDEKSKKNFCFQSIPREKKE